MIWPGDNNEQRSNSLKSKTFPTIHGPETKWKEIAICTSLSGKSDTIQI